MAIDAKLTKTTINLRKSIATDYVPYIVNKLALATDAVIFPPPGANPALPVQNNGIERNGGITNMYVQNQVYTTGAYGVTTGFNFPTQDGHLLSINTASTTNGSSVVEMDGKTLGQISQYGVQNKLSFSGYDDIVPTTAGTFLGCKISGNTITKTEISATGVVLNSTSNVYSLLTALNTSYTSVNFVETSGTTYSQNQEYIVKIGQVGYVLKEAQPNTVSFKLGNQVAYYITSCINYSNYAIFGTADGSILSIDYNGNYRLPSGSGSGLVHMLQLGQ